jgi:processive 1,2-diacylglycerol beta-glucosyltransferase
MVLATDDGGCMSIARPAPVLIVSASAGAGHVSAGNALADAFRSLDARRHVEHVDVLDLAPRWIRTAYGSGFEMMAAHTPRLWREVYRRADGDDCNRARWGPLAHRILFRRFRELLLSDAWGVCVCTHFLPGQLAAGRPGHPVFATVITDFGLHRYWVQPRVPHYFVATEAMARELRDRLPRSTVLRTGIPVRPAFAGSQRMQDARTVLGVAQDQRIVLAMGGGIGIGVEDAVMAALESDATTGVIAVCGRNEGAYARLRALGLSDTRLRVLGQRGDVNLLMAAADVIVTKPGGITCSEALALGRPLVLTRAIPGHEELNVQYLAGAGAAHYAPTREDLIRTLQRLRHDPGEILRMTVAARRIGAANAARDIAAALCSATQFRAEEAA